MKITRKFTECSNRYAFDFGECSYANGWAQVDTPQDASYFGTWCNPTTYEMLQFSEGDVTHTKCEDPVEFANEIDDFCATFEGKIDAGLGEGMEQLFVGLGMGHLLH